MDAGNGNGRCDQSGSERDLDLQEVGSGYQISPDEDGKTGVGQRIQGFIQSAPRGIRLCHVAHRF